MTQVRRISRLLCMTQVTRFSIGEASARLGVSPSTLRRYVRSGKVAALQLPSGHLRFLEADIEDLVAHRSVSNEMAGESVSSAGAQA